MAGWPPPLLHPPQCLLVSSPGSMEAHMLPDSPSQWRRCCHQQDSSAVIGLSALIQRSDRKWKAVLDLHSGCTIQPGGEHAKCAWLFGRPKTSGQTIMRMYRVPPLLPLLWPAQPCPCQHETNWATAVWNVVLFSFYFSFLNCSESSGATLLRHCEGAVAAATPAKFVLQEASHIG